MARQPEDEDINWEDGVDVRWIQGKRVDLQPPPVGPWVWTVVSILVGAVIAIVMLGVIALGWWR